MSEKRPTLVLTGATGFIGRHVADFFVQKDWHVIAFVRTAPEKHHPQILYVRHDLSTEEVFSFPEEIDAFIHAGFIKQENAPDAFALNVKAAEKILDALRGKNVGTKLFLSSLSSDKNAASVYGRQKAAIEELFLREKGVVVNAGLVIGDGGLFASMRNYLKTSSRIPLFGKGTQPMQPVYIDDLVFAIHQIISKKMTGKLVVALDEAVPYREFYDALARSLRVEPKFVRAPYWLAGLGITLANFFGKKLPVSRENLLGLKQMKKIPSEADLKKIGVKLRNIKESFSKLA